MEKITAIKIKQKYLKVLLGASFIGIAAGSILLYNVKPTYTSTASVLINIRAPEAIGPQSVEDQLTSNYLLTQEDILKSERVAREVVHDKDNEQLIKSFKNENSELSSIPSITRRLMSGLSIEAADTNSRVMRISYKSPNQKFAEGFANAFAHAFIKVSLDIQNGPNVKLIRTYENQLLNIDSKIKKTQNEIVQKAGVLSELGAEFDSKVAEESISELSQGLAKIQLQRSTYKVDYISPLPSHPTVETMLEQISKLESLKSKMKREIGSNHPDYKSVEFELNSLKLSLSEFINALKEGRKQEKSELAKAESLISQRISKSNLNLISVKEEEDYILFLNEDLKNAYMTRGSLEKRLSEIKVMYESNQGNISLLSTASTDESYQLLPILLRSIPLALPLIAFFLLLYASISLRKSKFHVFKV